MRSPALLTLLVLGAIPLVGCDDDIGRGQLVGSLEITDCRDGEPVRYTCPDAAIDACDALALEFDFFALDQLGDAARMTMQVGGQVLGRTDGVLFEVADLRQLRGRLGRSIPVGPDRNLRVGLALFELCPDSTQSFEITGSMVFDALGVERGDRVAGRIERLEVRDGRAEDGLPGPLRGFLRGSFDFVLQVGPPYQRFSR